MQCPKCASRKISKNGIRDNHKQNYRCNECGRQFVENPSGHYRISEETRRFVDRLLLEKLSLAGIVRAAKVSESWLQRYVKQKYQQVPRNVEPKACSPPKKRVVIECDELWSFVGKKARKQWIWIAMDRGSRLVVAMHIGSRGLKGAKGLWQNLPESYREQALFYNDFWEAYRAILLRERHRAAGKVRVKQIILNV